MVKHQFPQVFFVPKPTLNEWASKVTLINNPKQQNPKNIKQLLPNEQNDSLCILSDCPENVESPSNVMNINNNQNKNKKYFKVLLISVGVLLILGILASVAMGIYALVYITRTTVTSTTMTTTTTTTTTTTSTAAQCYSYTTMNDVTRLATAGSGSTTDYGLFSTGTWVRFSGAGGTQITTSSPGLYRCTTYYSGWYSGSLPSSGETVNGTVCYTYSSSSCYYANIISVTNCGSFYVYDLVNPPVSNSRYCTV
ncbi:unnamed protein product [Adineta steineri]|uniref:Uncharacterized protein n=3 Tax=Adineta steineri TaxID=433720 RepID=A0A819T335_9BILA|nr:unnamed protein product [Adineta steineri]